MTGTRWSLFTSCYFCTNFKSKKRISPYTEEAPRSSTVGIAQFLVPFWGREEGYSTTLSLDVCQNSPETELFAMAICHGTEFAWAYLLEPTASLQRASGEARTAFHKFITPCPTQPTHRHLKNKIIPFTSFFQSVFSTNQASLA